ncbi:MAG TPA: hypothetical protein VHM19_08855 [Polyangiales bacterium]|nr:hypothetical protein [Polyangiales bacterium]
MSVKDDVVAAGAAVGLLGQLIEWGRKLFGKGKPAPLEPRVELKPLKKKPVNRRASAGNARAAMWCTRRRY